MSTLKIILIIIAGIFLLSAITIGGCVAYIWYKVPKDFIELVNASALTNQGKYEEAIEIYDKLLEKNPELFTAWEGKGQALQGQGKYEEALLCYDKGLEKLGNEEKIEGT